MDYYKQIFRRKSFHNFNDVGVLSKEELCDLQAFIKDVVPLDESIKTKIVIVPESETTCKRGGEYCILFYSEKRGDYLRNAGYMGEQIDLYLASKNIGALWYGIGTAKQKVLDGLHYVIMIAIAKVDADSFRKDMFKAKRKALSQIWEGESLGVGEILRFAPSACNSQPWFVSNENGKLTVYRYKKTKRSGVVPIPFIGYYNKIDVGIFLFMLEVCLKKEGYDFERQTFLEKTPDGVEQALVATYSYFKRK